jgi:hypothetical protein
MEHLKTVNILTAKAALDIVALDIVIDVAEGIKQSIDHEKISKAVRKHVDNVYWSAIKNCTDIESLSDIFPSTVDEEIDTSVIESLRNHFVENVTKISSLKHVEKESFIESCVTEIMGEPILKDENIIRWAVEDPHTKELVQATKSLDSVFYYSSTAGQNSVFLAKVVGLVDWKIKNVGDTNAKKI